MEIIGEYLPQFQKDLPARSQEYIDLNPFHKTFDKDNFEGTALHDDGACIFLTMSDGIAMCGIEKAHNEGKIPLRKPISCHLYPIRVDKLKVGLALNYHKWPICAPACDLGDKLNVKVFRFLKEPLIRKFGQDFYEHLENIDKLLEEERAASK